MTYNSTNSSRLPTVIEIGRSIGASAYARAPMCSIGTEIPLENRIDDMHICAEEEQRMFSGIVDLMKNLEANPAVYDLFIAYHKSTAPTSEKKKLFKDALMDIPIRDPNAPATDKRGISIKHKVEFQNELHSYVDLWKSYASIWDHDSEPQGSYVGQLTRYDRSKVDPKHLTGRIEKEFPEFHKATSIDSLYCPATSRDAMFKY